MCDKFHVISTWLTILYKSKFNYYVYKSKFYLLYRIILKYPYLYVQFKCYLKYLAGMYSV